MSKPSSVGRQPCCCCPNIFCSAFSWAGHAAEAGHCTALRSESTREGVLGAWHQHSGRQFTVRGELGGGGSDQALPSWRVPRPRHGFGGSPSPYHSIAGVLATKNTCRGEVVMGESRAAVEVMPQGEGTRDGSSDQSLSTRSRVSLSSYLSLLSSASLAAGISTGREWEEEYSIPLL